METPIYLDHHATTPCDPRVVEAMLPYFSVDFGNPASPHHFGRRASNAIEDARVTVARFFGVQSNEIVFTAGATEGNNAALGLLQRGEHAISSLIEHTSVLRPLERARDAAGAELTLLTTDMEGRITVEQVEEALQPNTRLVSIEAANGEIGVLHPIQEIGALCRERGIVFHSDITQAVGKIPLDLTNVDLATWSAHKFYGPKGIGGLFVRRNTAVRPLLLGGGQESGRRSGTVNVPAVVGMGKAFALRAAEMEAEGVRLAALRDELRDRVLSEIDGSSVNGPRSLRLPGNLNLSFDRIEADSLILALRRFAVSAGSACSSRERGPSRILNALGVPHAELGAIRIGLGTSNTADHINMLVDDLKRAVARLREISAA